MTAESEPSTPAAGKRGPSGSAFDQKKERKGSRTLRRRIRGWFSRVFVGLAAMTLPYLYYAYCWFVWKTSRVDDELTPNLVASYERHDRFVALLWHQEVFTVAYAYRHLYGHTLASTGNFGRLITRMLEVCNFNVFRGGSTGSKTRKRNVLVYMIRHMQETPRAGYGVTVDGSHGPALRMKKGGAAIAKACKAPIYVVRTWCSNRLLAPTWDSTAFPLPFGRIKMWAVGPYWIDPNCSDEEFEATCAHLESELLDLAEHSFRTFEKRRRDSLREGFPPDWRPRWTKDALGVPLGPHDLRPEDPPEWSHKVGDPLKAPKNSKTAAGNASR